METCEGSVLLGCSFGSFVVPPPMKMTAARATELDFHARWRVETHGFLRMTMTFQKGTDYLLTDFQDDNMRVRRQERKPGRRCRLSGGRWPGSWWRRGSERCGRGRCGWSGC